MKKVVVLGATGLVGGAIVECLANKGHTVVAVGRNEVALLRLASIAPSARCLAGDVSTDDLADRTARGALQALGSIDLVIASLNPPRSTFRVTERSTEELAQFFDATLLTHVRAAKAFVPRIAAGGAFVGVGGASSDFVWPEHGHISTNQAAQRMLYKVLAHEYKAREVAIYEYVIAAMVHDGSGTAGVSAAAIGEDVARLAGLPGFGPDAVVRFPARGA